MGQTFTKPEDIKQLPKMYKIRNNRTTKRFVVKPFQSSDDWLQLAKEWKDELEALMDQFIGNSQAYSLAISDGHHEIAVDLLNRAWFNAPDAIELHSLPGWDVLCHLCSDYGTWENPS